MKRAALIVNPTAGRGRFEAMRHNLVEAFAKHGISVQIDLTTPEPDAARMLAQRATQSCDLVIACGGDGTVHGVLQGVAGTSSILGVLPFGTANALARNLSLPLDPVLAVEWLLRCKPQQIPLGRATSAAGNRYFLVMAGAGPDGTLVQEMQQATKARAGRGAYHTEAARLFLTRSFPGFAVEYRQKGSSRWETQPAVAMMASRIPNLGGLFKGLTRASRPHHAHLLIQLLRAPAHLALPAWITLGKAGLDKLNPWLTSLEVEELRCIPLHTRRLVHTQVDGEPFGPLPLSLSIVPSALHLLMPEEPSATPTAVTKALTSGTWS